MLLGASSEGGVENVSVEEELVEAGGAVDDGPGTERGVEVRDMEHLFS